MAALKAGAAAALEVAAQAYGPSERLATLGLQLRVQRAAGGTHSSDRADQARLAYALEALAQ